MLREKRADIGETHHILAPKKLAGKKKANPLDLPASVNKLNLLNRDRLLHILKFLEPTLPEVNSVK